MSPPPGDAGLGACPGGIPAEGSRSPARGNPREGGRGQFLDGSYLKGPDRGADLVGVDRAADQALEAGERGGPLGVVVGEVGGGDWLGVLGDGSVHGDLASPEPP